MTSTTKRTGPLIVEPSNMHRPNCGKWRIGGGKQKQTYFRQQLTLIIWKHFVMAWRQCIVNVLLGLPCQVFRWNLTHWSTKDSSALGWTHQIRVESEVHIWHTGTHWNSRMAYYNSPRWCSFYNRTSTTCLADLGLCTDCQQGGLLQLGSRWYPRPAARPAAVRLECRIPFGFLSENA